MGRKVDIISWNNSEARSKKKERNTRAVKIHCAKRGVELSMSMNTAWTQKLRENVDDVFYLNFFFLHNENQYAPDADYFA